MRILRGYIKRLHAFTEVFNPVELPRKIAFTLAEVFNPLRQSKKIAFTLAEVLLALVIMGVIASLTLPTLIMNFQNNAMLTSLKKNYNDLQQNLAYLQSERFYRGSLTKSMLSLANAAGATLDTTAGRFFNEYYNSSTNCGENATNGCFAAKYTTLSGSSVNFKCEIDNRKGISKLLKNGSAICIIPADMDGTDFIPAVVYIDVNGAKNPNKAGRDLFTFNIYNDFSVDELSPEEIKDGTERKSADHCKSTTEPIAEGCFGNILENNWKIKY